MTKGGLVILVVCLIKLNRANTSPPLLETPLGQIEGFMSKTIKDRDFYAFEGIPYAKPPVGKLRFKPPEEVEPFKNGKIKADKQHYCIQWNKQFAPPGEDPVLGVEDCLYVNIYTPTLDQKANLDVIVYIHGGCLMFGGGSNHQPHFLLDKDVILVTINYRLGPMGFLTTENKVVPGNNGLKDQIQALKFVQKYIRLFGGNPDSVTIFGNSAGGASVHIHTLSPLSKGLFHRAFAQSGTALNPWVLMENGREKTWRIGEIVNCTTDGQSQKTKDLIKCLRKRPARDIVEAVEQLQPFLYNPFSPFGAVVDSWSSEPVLPSHPVEILRQGPINDVPLIVSLTDGEGLYPAADFYRNHLEDIHQNWDTLIPHILDFNHTVEKEFLKSVAQRLQFIYGFTKQELSKDTFRDFVDLLSDRLFNVDAVKSAKYQAAISKSPVYFYLFKHRGQRSRFDPMMTTTAEESLDFGASHSDDNCYSIKCELEVLNTENDRKMVEIMVNLLTTFAHTGKPELTNGLDWPSVAAGENSFQYVQINSPQEIKLANSAEEKLIYRSEVWDQLPLKENEKLITLQEVERDMARANKISDEL